MDQPLEACLWLTPKILDDLHDPRGGIDAFFDHYAPWSTNHRLTVVFATSNGDHILCWDGQPENTFDWARYNCFAADVPPREHNGNWLHRVRDGGERSHNPYSAGPMVTISEQQLDYATLAGCYAALRASAAERGITLTLLEYLEPGPEFCNSHWKTIRHPEASNGAADSGGHLVPGVIDVTAPLAADPRPYAGYPEGVPAGTFAGDFVATQTAAYLTDFGLDGVMLGNQFGLLGFWDPEQAPPVTAQRSAGIARFFTQLRRALGDRQLYWMDTYWRAEVERQAWGMPEAAYAAMDAILVSAFAVLVERTEIVPNLLSKAALRGPRVLFGLDFVDPWYWYRTYLDDIRTYRYQRKVLAENLAHLDGVSFFANDTFGHFVPANLLEETLAVTRPAGTC